MAHDRKPHAHPDPPRLGAHAIVIGASIAGLLAARVLADSYDRVTVLDRDTLTDGLDGRRAVPQGRHAHALQFGGQRALEGMFEGFTREALQAGAPPLKFGTEMRMRAGGHLLSRLAAGPQVAIASRPLLEELVRRRVRALPNVTVRDNYAVSGLTASGDRVTGVRAAERGRGNPIQTLRADLVVAASGRGGKVPAWLEALGYERPAEERVAVDILYVSRRMRLRPGALPHDKAILDGARPGRPRGMAMLIEEDDRWNVTLYGYGAGHRPPTDDAGWKAFAATVTDPDVVAALEQAEPLGEIVTHAYPASVRRRYDRLKRFPDRLLVMGDALCTFNPIYGQGMAVATLEAVELRKCLLEGEAGLSRRFMKAAQGPVEHAWKLATGADLALPEIDQVAPLPDRIMGRYMQRLLAVASHDEVVTRAFLAVTGMVAPPTHLLSPAVLRRVLRGVPRAAARSEQAVVLQPAEASA